MGANGGLCGNQSVLIPHDCGGDSHGCSQKLQEMEDSKFEDIVLHDDAHCTFDVIDGETVKQLWIKFGKPPADEFGGVVGIDVVIY